MKKTVLLLLVLAICVVLCGCGGARSKLEEVRSQAVQIAGGATAGDDYFCLDTYPDEYETMDPLMVAMLLPGKQENVLEAIRYANKALGFGDSVYSLMLETTSLMGRQSEENEEFIVTWTYHPDDGLEVTYRIK